MNGSTSEIRDFRNLKVWQKSRYLTQETYKIAENFPSLETHAMKSQILRAVTSIGANIAEGNTIMYIKKQLSFYNNALGSAGEVRHWFIIANDRSYITNEEFILLNSVLDEIIKMLYTIIRNIDSQIYHNI